MSASKRLFPYTCPICDENGRICAPCETYWLQDVWQSEAKDTGEEPEWKKKLLAFAREVARDKRRT